MSTMGYTNDEEEWKQNCNSYYVYDK